MPPSPLDQIARALVAPGKGILAADESFGTIEKRFRGHGIEANEENRRAYRETLLTTPRLGDFISGVILFDETLRQKTISGLAFPLLLEQQGIIPGIKVDLGTDDLTNFPGEKITQGLDGLRERLKSYRELGARFTKWRAVLTVNGIRPTRACLLANAQRLAMFAALSQEADLVPIVEPEILMDGDHSVERAEAVTNATLHAVFDALFEYRVRLEAMLLKPAMVLPGTDSVQSITDKEIASRTLGCLRRSVPAAVPGIVFLSGGQAPSQATARLGALNRIGHGPWALSFSFGRALQDAALKAWSGRVENVQAAQSELLRAAEQNSAAIKQRPA